MTKTTLAALAAALIAGSALSSTAQAGGVRVGFGFPLGSFVAHSHQSYNQSSSYGYRKSCDKPVRAARHVQREEAPVRKAHRPAPKIKVVEEAPVRVIKKTKPIQTATLENNEVKNDAAPTVYVPAAPAAVEKPAEATSAPVTTAALAPTLSDSKPTETTTATATPATIEPVKATTVAPVKEDVKADAPKTEKIEKVEKDTTKVKVSGEAKRLCRRFSAAIAGLIDVPCE
jgi:hypothetical protein